MPFKPTPGIAAELERRAGQLLIVAAIEVESQMFRELTHSYPPASKPGEFPARRTGNLQNSPMHEPVKAMEVGKKAAIRVGYAKRADYGARLEGTMRRLGFREVVQRLRGQLNQLLGSIGERWSDQP